MTVKDKPTGQEQTSISSQVALAVLQKQAEQYGLDTPATAELMQSASMAMAAHPTQTISDLTRTLTPIYLHFTKAGLSAPEVAQIQADVLNAVQTDITWSVSAWGKKGAQITAKLRT